MFASWMMGEEERGRLEMLYDRYKPVLLRFAYEILKSWDESEDCVADVFEKLAWMLRNSPEKIGDVEDRKTGNFLITITKNRARNMVRKNSRISLMEPDDQNFHNGSSDEDVEYLIVNVAESRERMKLALGSMDEKYSAPLRLKFCLSFTIPEIAKVLDISENHASVLIYRGKKFLKEALQAYEEAE